MGAGITVSIALLAGLSAAPVRASLADDRITAAEAAAKAGAATPEGKNFEEAVGQAFGREHGATVGQCAKTTRRPDLSDFDLFLRVDGRGVVEEALVRPSTNLSGCVQSKLIGWRAPAPPHPGLWVKLGVNLKRK